MKHNSHIVTHISWSIIALINTIAIFDMETKPPHLTLPCNVILPIIYDEKCLNNTIKSALILKQTCKHFNTMLSPETIGNFCKGYDIVEKNNTITALLKKMHPKNYWQLRHKALILIHAGAHDEDLTKPLFQQPTPLLKHAIDCCKR
jgi:hypothetical protein